MFLGVFYCPRVPQHEYPGHCSIKNDSAMTGPELAHEQKMIKLYDNKQRN